MQTDYMFSVLTILKWLGVCTYKVLTCQGHLCLKNSSGYMGGVLFGCMGICFQRVSTY